MVNQYKDYVNIQDIENHLQENALHHFLHYSFYEIFIKLKSIFDRSFCDIAEPYKIFTPQYEDDSFIFIIIFNVFVIIFCISINKMT